MAACSDDMSWKPAFVDICPCDLLIMEMSYGCVFFFYSHICFTVDPTYLPNLLRHIMPRFGSTCLMLESYMTYDAHASRFDFLVLFPMFIIFVLSRVPFIGLRRQRGVQRRKIGAKRFFFAWLS
jgi:hypothetical protein